MPCQHVTHLPGGVIGQTAGLQKRGGQQTQAKIPQQGLAPAIMQGSQPGLDGGQTPQHVFAGAQAIGKTGKQAGAGSLLRMIQPPVRCQRAQHGLTQAGLGQRRAHAGFAQGAQTGTKGPLVIGIAAVAEHHLRRRGQGATQALQQRPLAGIAALRTVARHIRQIQRPKVHHMQAQSALACPEQGGLAFLRGHVRAAGMQGTEGQALTLQGKAEKAAVHTAGIGHSQRAVAGLLPQTAQHRFKAGARRRKSGRRQLIYHVRRTLAPCCAMISLHWRMLYWP